MSQPLIINNDLQELLTSREDISDYVFHFTKSEIAFDILKSILKDGKIKDIGGRGYICFTEAPILMLPNMFSIFSENVSSKYYQKYMPYGIGIKKNHFYEMGGRPVIYGDKEDEVFLKNTHLFWRFQYYDPNYYDWTWLREWRIKQTVILDPKNMFIVLPSKTDRDILLQESFDIEFDGDIEDGQFHCYATGVSKKRWSFKAISIEQIKNNLISTKSSLKNNLNSQQLEESEYINLGSNLV